MYKKIHPVQKSIKRTECTLKWCTTYKTYKMYILAALNFVYKNWLKHLTGLWHGGLVAEGIRLSQQQYNNTTYIFLSALSFSLFCPSVHQIVYLSINLLVNFVMWWGNLTIGASVCLSILTEINFLLVNTYLV